MWTTINNNNYPFNPIDLERKVLIDEDKLRGCKVEEAYVFDNEGNNIAHGKGTETELRPENFCGKDMREGIILTHYHTDNDSLTKADIKFAMEYEYIEIRAVTDENLFIAHFPDNYDKNRMIFWLDGFDDSARTWHETWMKKARDIGFLYYSQRRDDAHELIKNLLPSGDS